jgi:hypothetical protein
MGNVNQRLSKQYKNDPIMELTKLGWNSGLDQQFAPYNAKGLVPVRVAAGATIYQLRTG